MADTTGRIPLWLISTITGIPVIGSIGVFFFLFRVGFIPVVIIRPELET